MPESNEQALRSAIASMRAKAESAYDPFPGYEKMRNESPINNDEQINVWSLEGFLKLDEQNNT